MALIIRHLGPSFWRAATCLSMHPLIGCDQSLDKLAVTLECVAQDLESTTDESESEDPPSFAPSPHISRLTITELSDSSSDANLSDSLPQAPADFSTMASFNNGFTFPSPSVVASTTANLPQSCPPFAIVSSVVQCAPTCTSSITSIQFPTPAVGGMYNFPKAGTSVYSINSRDLSSSWVSSCAAGSAVTFTGASAPLAAPTHLPSSTARFALLWY